VAGNLVEVVADSAKVPENLTQHLRIDRGSALGAWACVARKGSAGEGGGRHARLVGTVEESGFFLGREADE